MDQHSATAGSTLVRAALRVLLLLGGALVWWLLATNAPAQADDTATSTGQSAVADAGSSPDRTAAVKKTTQKVTRTLRDAPRRAARTVSAATASAPAPVRTTADHLSATVEPTLLSTTDAMAALVDRSVQTVSSAVDQVGTPATGQVPAPTTLPTTATTTATGDRTAWARHLGVGPDRTVGISGADRSGPAQRIGIANSGGIPRPADPAAPVASWSGPSGSSATLAGMLLVLFLLFRTRRVHQDSVLLLGPAYPPGSSPG